MADWQPIETAPRDGTRVLLFREGEQMVGYWNPDFKEWCVSPVVPESQVRTWTGVGPRDFSGVLMWGGPTHWMPLPEPPA